MHPTFINLNECNMKHISQILSVFLLAFVLVSCGGDTHFLTEETYRRQVENDFQKKKQCFADKQLFAVFDTELTAYEREALEFLYAYMPIGDITDYSGAFYLENIRLSEQARHEMPWGKTVPAELYRHFVLPVRVNNENLDEARRVFYGELKDRVAGLSMYDAILEVNHWCHEKVIYRPSDARTSSPLASVKTAFGRCGEESTFAVAALRSVGIPARQVYTPRWAHTDDNHAWVEAWADGKWYFLGACEPEPVLNLGWFNAPASRGMLMHTKVFGRYSGPEEIMLETPNYTEINVIENYAPTSKADITVVDEAGQPVDGAWVEFKLYNYAEFFTVARKQTGADGKVSLTAGRGDMLVWASKGDKFGYLKYSFGTDEAKTITLNRAPGEEYAVELDIVPPAERPNVPEVTAEQRAENDRRMLLEDSIRNAYTATFPTEAQAADWAAGMQLDPERVAPLLVASRGNHATLTAFLKSAVQAGKAVDALNLLEVISEKDLRDITPEVLEDHLNRSFASDDCSYVKALLNPRIANEMLTPYKGFFASVVSQEDAAAYRANPTLLVDWCKQHITIDNSLNSQSIPVSPAGVWKARVADDLSRDIFFVALSRSVGIPAWIDGVTGKVQYKSLSDGGKVYDVDFETAGQSIAPSGTLQASYEPIRSLDNPKYYNHFTLSKFDNGTFRLLSYDEGDATWDGLLRKGTSLDAGYYMMVSGTRLASGAVLARLNFFNITADKQTNTQLVMRESKDQVQVIGNFNSESLFRPVGENQTKSILQACGRGYFVVAVLGAGQEPTNHALKDIALLKDDFEKWGRKLVLLFPDEANYKRFNPSEFPGLPSTIVYGIDEGNSIQKQIVENMKLASRTSLPVFIIADTFNRVVFVSQGYTIGLGEQLMKVVHGI